MQFTGIGLKKAEIRTSLLTVETDIQCGSSFLEDQLCKGMIKLSGTYSIHQASTLVCSISTHACGIMSRMYWCSYCIFFTFVPAVISATLGACLLYYYWT